jgi:hypothetical protein
MKRLFKLIFWLLILSPFIVVGAVIVSIETQPLVSSQFSLTPAQVEREKRLAHEHDPRKANEGEIKSVSLSEQELTLLAAYLLNVVDGAAAVSLQSGWLDLVASVKVPKTPLGQYINFRVGLRETDVLPRFRYLKLGKVPVPNMIADFVLEKSLDHLYSRPGYEVAEDIIQKIALSEQQMQVTYKWHAGITDVVRSTLVSGADQERLRVFQHELAKIANGLGSRASLEDIMQPMFAFAHRRAAGGDPVEDNRAALVVLCAYINGRNLERLAPDVSDWKKAKRVRVKSHGRDDLPKHFLTSAGLAVTGGTTLSQAIGLFKEVDDSQGGSGFSFTDLLADYAGTRFGEIAVKSSSAAEALQSKLAGSVTEKDLIPQVLDLPEGLTEHEFKRQYGEIGSPAYNKVVQVIEKRIAGSRLYN